MKTRFSIALELLNYSPADAKSIEAHAKSLSGKTLRQFVPAVTRGRGGRGEFGSLLEEFCFYLLPDSSPIPDFPEIGLELKSTGLKNLKRKGLVGKERLVLGMIDYQNICSEDWSASGFLKKNSWLLILFYIYEKGRAVLDHPIKDATLWRFPEDDLLVIRQDWENIVAQIRIGQADLLSESSTRYLAASTKGSNSAVRTAQPFSPTLAKPRAFSLKQGYVTFIYKTKIEGLTDVAKPVVRPTEIRAGETFEEAIIRKFEGYYGKTREIIASEVGLSESTRKDFYSALTRKILGLMPKDEIAEFLKSDTLDKTVRLNRSGTPEEDISFPAFRYVDILDEEWEQSTFRQLLLSRFFFVIFAPDHKNTLRLNKVGFWSMPIGDREKEGKRIWKETVGRIRAGKAAKLPLKDFSTVFHVRPHGADKLDKAPVPGAEGETKKCFWINRLYIKPHLQQILNDDARFHKAKSRPRRKKQ